jgi:8-oxo-dGTP diphosphatase
MTKHTKHRQFVYPYPRAALTVDCVVFGYDERTLKVLLIQRALPPFKGCWALPGGFVHADETLDTAARRELKEEAGLTHVFIEQLYTFGNLDRDPRERVVSVAYYALVKLSEHTARAATDAAEARWFPIETVPRLAFDHAAILEAGLARLRSKALYEPLGFELLPGEFTLSELQHLYQALLGQNLDKRNFRKKVLGLGFLVPLKSTRMIGRHRPARLFRFHAEKYATLRKKGFHFEL